MRSEWSRPSGWCPRLTLGVGLVVGVALGLVLLFDGGGFDGLGAGREVEPVVAPSLGPFVPVVAPSLGQFVVLFGQDRADQEDDAGAVGEDPHNIGAATDFAVEALVWAGQPDLAPDLLRKAGGGEDVRAGFFVVFGHRRELLVQGVEDAVDWAFPGRSLAFLPVRRGPVLTRRTG